MAVAEHLPPCPPMPENPDDSHPPANKPIPGQLYSLRQDLAGWGEKGRYYNPPVVLLLACPDTDAVLVCQTYGDPAFAGPGDVALGALFTGFAQLWNRYTLLRTDLDTYLGTVDAPILATIDQAGEQDALPLQPGTLLWFFRQMEVETGYFFSRRAVEQLMTAHEDQSLSFLASAKIPIIRQDLDKLPVHFSADTLGEISVLELFLHTEPDDRLLPLAAADCETQPALRFSLQGDRIIAAELQQISISSFDYAQGILTISGATDAPYACKQTWIFGWRVGGHCIEPLPELTGQEGKYFWVAFALSPDQLLPPSQLVVRILSEEEE